MTEREIIAGFEDLSLPKSEWTHEAHIIVAVWHCMQHDAETSLNLIRQKITRYNETVGTPNTDHEGYHETITAFWVWQTNAFLAQSEAFDFAELCKAMCASDYGRSAAPLRHYSKERLFSIEARKNLLPPNLKPMETPKRTYMIVERYVPGKVRELYARFDQKGRMLPDGVVYLNSWIDHEVKTCYQLMESESLEKLEQWIACWDDLANFEITAVLPSLMAKRKALINA